MQKVVQIEGVSLEELLQGIRCAITPDLLVVKPAGVDSVRITVLNKKDAAKTLNIGESLFSKLHSLGIIPATVNAGVNKKGELIERWAQHHLIAIKPVVQQLRYKQTESAFDQAKKTVINILGL